MKLYTTSKSRVQFISSDHGGGARAACWREGARSDRTHRVRMQVLLLAQPIQERSLLFEQRLPRREEHGAADVQPDPLAAVSAGRVDRRAVAEALRRRRPSSAVRGGGGGRALARLAVFIVVVIVVVAVVLLAAAAVTRRRSDGARRLPLLIRRGRHRGNGREDTEGKTSDKGDRPSVTADTSAALSRL